MILEAGVGAGRELVLKLLDTTGGIDELQLTCVERMADIANVDLQFFTRTPCFEAVSATAGDLRFEVLWVNAVFHNLCSVSLGVGLNTTRKSTFIPARTTMATANTVGGHTTIPPPPDGITVKRDLPEASGTTKTPAKAWSAKDF